MGLARHCEFTCAGTQTEERNSNTNRDESYTRKKALLESSNGLISEVDNTERKFYFLQMYQQNLEVIFTYFASTKILHDHNSFTYHIQDFFTLHIGLDDLV